MLIKSLSIALIAATLSSIASAAPEIGKPAPDFKAKDIAGKEQSLALYKGKIVVLEWSNPECPFVVKHYKSNNMQSLQQYATSKDVVWLKINSSAEGKQGNLTPETAKKSLEEAKSAPTAYILDPKGEIGKLYDAKTTPHMFVIDKTGSLAYMGAIDDKPTFEVKDIEGARNYVREAINALLAEKPVKETSTKAYGCSVKY